jgi:hypothetical protein
MDDYTSNVLSDSKNEWSILLINYITPHIIDGFRSIFNESVNLCQENDESEKYLMTYQNLLARIPKWNQTMINTEHERIVKLCNCSYLEDILTCVHIIQLKILSCVRVGNETKKVKINIPEFNVFLHKVYINIARKLYSSIYLFELEIAPLEQQKRNREFEIMVQTCIMNTIRDGIPVETLLRQYIDETQEIEIIKEEKIIDKIKEESDPKVSINVKEPTNVNEPSNVKEPTLVKEPLFVKEEPIVKKQTIVNENSNMNLNSFDDLNKKESKVGFSDNDSVLTFETEKDTISFDDSSTFDLDFEDLDLSKTNEPVNITFEEL